MISRRHLLCTAACVVLPVSASASIATLKEIAQLMSAAADAVRKLFDLVVDAVKTGARAYDELKDRAIRASLIRLSQLTSSVISANEIAQESIDRYIGKAPSMSPEVRSSRWASMAEHFRTTLKTVYETLKQLTGSLSEFVLHPAYEEMQKVLARRGPILEGLVAMSAPTSPDELEELRTINEHYKRLTKRLSTARGELGDFLRAP